MGLVLILAACDGGDTPPDLDTLAYVETKCRDTVILYDPACTLIAVREATRTDDLT